MSTYINDLASNCAVSATDPSLTAATTGNTAGTSLDFLAGEGNIFAIQSIGITAGTSPSITNKIQESSDGTTWTDITGMSFTAATTINVQKVSGLRTKRYVRSLKTITGTGSLAIPVTTLIGTPLKVV